jgi:hypothetical protein
MILRLMDLDADERGRPCTLEVDGTVGFDAERGWYATYESDEMEWVPRATQTCAVADERGDPAPTGGQARGRQ